MGEQPLFAGLGKLYFCRVEDMEKEPQPLGEAVTLGPGMLTYKDDEPKSEYSAKGFSTTFTGTIEEPSPELMEVLVTPPNRWDVQLECKPGRLPRKIKKAYRMGDRYQRDTKWKRKAKAYERRFIYRLPEAEMVVTRKQMGVLEATIKGSSLQYNPDAVAHVSGKDMAAYVRKR